MKRLSLLGLLLLAGACSALPKKEPPMLMSVPRSPIDVAFAATNVRADLVDEPDFDLEEETRLDSIARANAPKGALKTDPPSTLIGAGVLKDRFQDAVRAEPESDEPAAARARVPVEWVRTTSYEDSLAFTRDWEGVRRTWRKDAEVTVRDMVWPGGAHVLRREAGSVQVATDWIEGRRVPATEMRCLNEADVLAEAPARVRLVGALVPGAEGGVLIRVGFEVDHPRECGISIEGDARVGAFAKDLWLAAYRLSAGEVGVHLLQ
jgi:hypothetical protein